VKARCLYPALFLISAVGIAYQILLMRIFSIAQWHHFAYMVISMAMLGFAAGGTVLTLLRQKIAGRETPLFRASILLILAALIICYVLSQRIPFETYQLVSQPKQFWNLLLLYAVLAIPFFFISCAVMLAFFLNPEHAGKVYGVNMVGSGVGAAAIVGLLFWLKPWMLPYLLTLPVGLAYFFSYENLIRRFLLPGVSLALVFLFFLLTKEAPIRVSEYKGLSYALRMPEAKVVLESQSPLSVVTAVASNYIRETPGQVSHRYASAQPKFLPEQIGLFFDADSLSVVNRFDGDLKKLQYLDYVTEALPYHLLKKPRVLIIGAGGGTDILLALLSNAPEITAVEIDPRVVSLIRENFGEFSGGLYDRPEVTAVIAEGREFLESSREPYNLIQIPPLESFQASAAGVYALNESYLYTTEALTLYLNRLSPNGILALTQWLKTPPRNAIKLFATAIEAGQKAGISEPANHLAFIRSWNTGTIIISKSPLTAEQISAIREFAAGRGFDVSYYPGIQAGEINRFTILENPIYEDAAQTLLFGNRKEFFQNYLFDVQPATDDRPYFFQFFKWAAFPRLLKGMGVEWVPFVEWGYLSLVATLIQSFLFSLFLIGIPWAADRRGFRPISGKRWVLLYFAAIGFAYMFLEIAFIQKFMLFLGYPIYSVAVVLTSFLIFSGLGSFSADFYGGRKTFLILTVVFAMVIVVLAYLFFLPRFFIQGAPWNDGLKIAASILLLSPLAFLMGFPFPTGLGLVLKQRPSLAAWAWAINGCASVIGAILATLLAVHWGFNCVVVIALLIYAFSVWNFVQMQTLSPRAT
jgi:spermidine synthase/MFS family permease